MARKRKTYMQKEGVQQDDARPYVHASALSGLASQPESAHHKESFNHFLRALARELARADHSHDG